MNEETRKALEILKKGDADIVFGGQTAIKEHMLAQSKESKCKRILRSSSITSAGKLLLLYMLDGYKSETFEEVAYELGVAPVEIVSALDRIQTLNILELTKESTTRLKDFVFTDESEWSIL